MDARNRIYYSRCRNSLQEEPMDTRITLKRPQCCTSADPHHRQGHSLILGDHSSHKHSPPPWALTQYVSISSANAAGKGGFATEETADRDSIYLPSTTGLRRGPHKEPFSHGGKQARRRGGSTASYRSFASVGRLDVWFQWLWRYIMRHC
jgi:hypothetical protein